MARRAKQSPARRCRGKQQGSASATRKSGQIERHSVQAEAEQLNQLQGADPELPRTRRPRPPGPDTCHQFVRRQLAKALPDLFDVLLKRANEGDLPAVKLLWQLAQLDKPTEQAGDDSEDRKFVRGTLAKYRTQ